MATAARSFTVLDPPARVWAVLVDFARWDRILVVSKAAEKGWGNQLLPRGPLGPGTALAMLCDGRLVQEWVIEEWAPGQRLGLSSRRWFGSSASQMSSRLSIALGAASAVETRVDLRLESRFTHPLWGPFFSVFIPLRRELRATLGRMEDGLTARLSGG